MPGSWLGGFQFAHMQPDPGPEGPGRETGTQPRGTVMLESSTGRWVAYGRLEDPPGLSPITTVGRFDTVDEAQIATDEVWASR